MFKKIRRWFQRPKNPAGNVYYAKLKTPQGTFYKLGYTSKPTLVERMAYGDSGDEKLIDQQFFFTFREDAWDVEQNLLEHFDRHRAFGKFSNNPKMPLSGRGQSELFTCDVLGVDECLYRQPDSDTLKAIQEGQEEARDGCLLILIGLVLAPFTLGISLLLVMGGASGIFGKKGQSVLPDRTRPIHPPAIQALIDALNCRSNYCSPACASPDGE